MNVHVRVIFVHAASRGTEAFPGGNRDCRDTRRKWVLGNVFLIRKIRRIRLTLRGRRGEKIVRRRKSEAEKGEEGGEEERG